VADGAVQGLSSLHDRWRALLRKEGLDEWIERRTWTASSVAVLGLVRDGVVGSKGRQQHGNERRREQRVR
jgi:putative SOS response-associated peptidase YedK